MSDVVTRAAEPPAQGKRPAVWLVVPLLGFAFVALVVGLLARENTDAGPSGYIDLFFSDPIHMKAWLATTAVALGLVQVFTATWIYRKLPWSKPAWVNPVHRWSGRLAFVATLPVAYHCIFKLGFEHGSDRVLFHSLLGCVFYGAYAAKVLIVRMKRFPGPTLPVAGGLLFAVLVGVWYTSALWFFRLAGLST
jgi:hypothetical protein